ncbi:pyruvate, phosphate dikinase [Candidatus Parcubacteria bacterium 4484_255]|nr:MAG: pyruvate, phosphate dikinase [Candidatus Parcubacteria bacterium 4484_255]
MKQIYYFGGQKADGNAQMKDLLGGKGANLAEMTNLGIPVPPGFTITTKVCQYFYQNNYKFPRNLDMDIKRSIQKMEKSTGKKFGDINNPLLLSVRSGAKISMPGMMDTILNLGLNDKIVIGLSKQTNNARFAFDAYRRLIHMFADVVLGIDKQILGSILEQTKDRLKIKFDTDLKEQDLRDIIFKYKKIIKQKTKKSFPQDPWQQLRMATSAVFKSWNAPRAQIYRRLNQIPENLGTAVNVQAMVFGNLGDDSATGVGFTRNPATGEDKFYGEYLINAQGEDVVAGVRTPKQIQTLKKQMPLIYKQLYVLTKKLEKHYKDVQDFEFTIERNKLYILQTRTGKRTAQAAVKIAVDMVKQKLITKKQAILMIQPEQISQLLHPIIDPKAKINIIAEGLPASPGAGVGQVVFDADEAVEKSRKGPVILVRTETCPDDIHGMNVSEGILTVRGGMTSHAAVVARGMGKCCVVGCESIKVNEKNKKIIVGSLIIKAGDWISLDGTKGQVILGKAKTIKPKLSGNFGRIMRWADEIRKIKVRANADNLKNAKVAKDFGAQGIGLCRTEHMFFDQERLPFMQEMILADNKNEREKALNKLLKFQKKDFKDLFREMKGFPVTIRTLDPPLHEFLPKNKEDIKKLSRKIKISEKEILNKSQELAEVNPMLGHRGCRLGITYPEIIEMQVKAIISAACELVKEKVKVVPEIMIPLVGYSNEFIYEKKLVDKIAKTVMRKYKVKIDYIVGTMIEVPRAVFVADKIAKQAEFFSFGTNDLTQMSLGFSRDDADKFIKIYLKKGILKNDPFQTLDQEGVGQLVEMGVQKGRQTKKNLKIGICGEHGGEPISIKFCCRVGMDYVSCSPYRVPIARLSAAQAILEK